MLRCSSQTHKTHTHRKHTHETHTRNHSVCEHGATPDMSFRLIHPNPNPSVEWRGGAGLVIHLLSYENKRKSATLPVPSLHPNTTCCMNHSLYTTPWKTTSQLYKSTGRHTHHLNVSTNTNVELLNGPGIEPFTTSIQFFHMGTRSTLHNDNCLG